MAPHVSTKQLSPGVADSHVLVTYLRTHTGKRPVGSRPDIQPLTIITLSHLFSEGRILKEWHGTE